MDDDGVCTTVPDPCLSLVTSVSLQFARACVVTESRGSYVKLNYMSIKADLATERWPLMGNIATKSWSMIEERASGVTGSLASDRAEISPFFLVYSHCTSFVEWILPCFCFAHKSVTCENCVFAHESFLRCPCRAHVKTLVKPPLEHLQYLSITKKIVLWTLSKNVSSCT